MENLNLSADSYPKLKPLESPTSAGWTYNRIGDCPSGLHHPLDIHGNPRLSHDHLCSFKHFFTRGGSVNPDILAKLQRGQLYCALLHSSQWYPSVFSTSFRNGNAVAQHRNGYIATGECEPCDEPCSDCQISRMTLFFLPWVFNPSTLPIRISNSTCKRPSRKKLPIHPLIYAELFIFSFL